MFNNVIYVSSSLETNLFFARIMKEHAIFLKAGLTPASSKLAKECDSYKKEFEKILLETVKLSDKKIKRNFFNCGEIITDYTLSAEKKTECYTGININSKITLLQKDLHCSNNTNISPKTVNCIKKLNEKIINSLNSFIEFKTMISKRILSCDLFTSNYPSMLEHLIEEAEFYKSNICDIENGKDIYSKNIKDIELFWDDIMKEHALFIRGLLDPTECALIDKSNQFSKDYSDLLSQTSEMNNHTQPIITKNTLILTNSLKDFKASATDGILNCKIKSIILPLLSDHVLREANHYLRLLKLYTNK